MRKLYTLAAIVATTFAFGQEAEPTEENTDFRKNTLSLNANWSDPGQFGLSYEFFGTELFSENSTDVVNVSFGFMSLDNDEWFSDITGEGFVIEVGHRNYLSENKKGYGLYTAGYLSYGNIKFDEDIAPFGKFEGTYSYFSFFSPELGYKIKAGNIAIDPFIGIMWKIEVKGKGDVDNNYTDEWVPRVGLKVGYNF